MQMTLDGYIAGPNGEMDWLRGGEDEWDEMLKFLRSVDTCVVGSGMYAGYDHYWRQVLSKPDAAAGELAYARFAESTSHVVFSQSQATVDAPNARVAHDVKTEINRMKQQEGKDIVAWGGQTFANSLIRLGLVDEYRITLNPTLLGAGKALFDKLEERKKLSLQDSRPMRSGNIVIRYGAG